MTKKLVFFAENPLLTQKVRYCFWCGKELKYLWFEDNGNKHPMGIGCNLTLYCDKCKTIFQPNVYFHLTLTDLKDYPAEIRVKGND